MLKLYSGKRSQEKIVDFIIIGVEKCGTTAACDNLNSHPRIAIRSQEPHFFNKGFGNWPPIDTSVDWYKNFLPEGEVVGEKTPCYIYWPGSIYRIKRLQPDVKLIIFLRNPVYRAYSRWHMGILNGGHKHHGWREKIVEDLQRIEETDVPIYNDIIQRGFYATQIENVLRLFSKEQLHISIQEHVLSNMQDEYGKIFEFLGVGEHVVSYKKSRIGHYKRMSEVDREFLFDYYKPYNEKLFNLLGYEIPEWDKSYTVKLNKKILIL